MRTIKFRAWDKKTKTMVYSGIEYELRCLEYPSKYGKDNKWGSDTIGFINTNDEYFEIMQYIGLNDRRNVEVFEGDILEVHNGEDRVVIEFQGGQFYGRNLDKNHPIVETQNRNWLQWDIIGNIHENPDSI